jgi:hypothetical protein
MTADEPTNAPESAPGASCQTNGKRKRKMPHKRPPRPGEGRPTKATPEIWEEICNLLSQGLTEEQACAYVGIAESTFNLWKQKPAFAEFRARAQACRILALQERKREAMEMRLDWKCVAWDLERIFKKQFALEPASVSLTQNNATLNLMDEQSLQEARVALDEARAIKEERRRRETETPIEEVRDDQHPATIVPAPDDLKTAEPEPSPQSPTPAEPVHPVEPSLRQKLLAQARRMGRSLRIYFVSVGAIIFTTSRQIPRIVPSGYDLGNCKVNSIVPSHPVYLPVPTISLAGELDAPDGLSISSQITLSPSLSVQLSYALSLL